NDAGVKRFARIHRMPCRPRPEERLTGSLVAAGFSPRLQGGTVPRSFVAACRRQSSDWPALVAAGFSPRSQGGAVPKSFVGAGFSRPAFPRLAEFHAP